MKIIIKDFIKFFCIITVFIIIIINFFVEMKYDMNIIGYIKNSRPLTIEQRDWLMNHENLIYCADQNAPPLRYIDEDGQYKGIVVDYINALSIEIGTKINIKPMLWSEALVSISNGKTDICDMFESPKRKKDLLFSNPIYNLRGVIVISNDELDIKSYVDLDEKKVATPKGDYAIEYLESKVKNIDYYFTKDIYDALILLKNGEVDAVIGDEPVISFFISELNISNITQILDPPIYEKDVVFGVPRSKYTLLDIINKGIFNIKRKNQIEKIQQKWFGISAPISKKNNERKIMIIVGGVIVLSIIITYVLYFFNKRLKIEVQRRTEELYISNNNLQTTFDGLTHYMVVLNNDMKIVNINKSFCKFINRDKESLIEKVLEDVCCDSNKKLIYEEVGKLVKKTFINNKEHNKKIKYKDNVYEVHTFPLKDKQKNIIKALVMIKDITINHINDKRLLQANKMAAIGQLAAGLAHEIRNPLGLVRNYVYILKMKMNMRDEKVKKAIDTIESSIDKANSTIDNVLNFSRISNTGKEKINMKYFIEDILELEKKIMKKNKIFVKIETDNIEININQESLKHILINLVTNAVDAMPNGGTIKIQCKKLNKRLYIFCSDTGIGIKEKDLEKLFNPFFTTKGIGKGTGLGLYILYNEVEKLGGEVKVYSKLDEGTTFEIYIPLEMGSKKL
ncbi:transporter substrate-binding domain-containing protein [Clostridium sp. D2Q-14]|uniref:transporter substrate-binding domain-containing protein n=1 Tax=Anaeromonas gelatinilytica TaxID=2683194 RepID=UPI00193C6A7E|nr:transporter substrate-binding domain-containing protein [Anaeromonas gelatinilytica]MBS4535189.1 transporter substrate-binding domain-containing protein [Anaeromonas gelatinilytica]